MTVKIQMQWALRFGCADLPRVWSMWAEVAFGTFCLSVALGYPSLPMIGLLLARACLENCLDFISLG